VSCENVNSFPDTMQAVTICNSSVAPPRSFTRCGGCVALIYSGENVACYFGLGLILNRLRRTPPRCGATVPGATPVAKSRPPLVAAGVAIGRDCNEITGAQTPKRKCRVLIRQTELGIVKTGSCWDRTRRRTRLRKLRKRSSPTKPVAARLDRQGRDLKWKGGPCFHRHASHDTPN